VGTLYDDARGLFDLGVKMENPFKPYSVMNYHSYKFTLPDDENNTEIIIHTKSEECRYGRDEQDVLLMKLLDDKYSNKTYTKHILEYIRNKLYFDEVENLELSNRQEPDIKLMEDADVEKWVDRCLYE